MKRFSVKKKNYLGSGKWQHVYCFKTKEQAEAYIHRDDIPYESDAEYKIVEEGSDTPNEISPMKANNPQHPVHAKGKCRIKAGYGKLIWIENQKNS